MTQHEPTHLDLFSGIGGFALAAKWAGFRTVAFCEIDKYCQKVLAKNFGAVLSDRRTEQSLQGTRTSSEARIHGSIFDFNGTAYQGCDLITGGFPCQPFSVAGQRRGAEDDRAIWPQMFRVISEARPAWVLGENVPGIIPMELDNVLSDLEGIGYACRAFVIPACAVDARHRRDRLWIIGRNIRNDSNSNSCDGSSKSWQQQGKLASIADSVREGVMAHSKSEFSSSVSDDGNGITYQESTRKLRGNGLRESLPNSSEQGLEGQREVTSGTGTQFNDSGDYCRWLPEPDVGRVAHGIPSRVDRLKGLGNAIVPQVAFEILKVIYDQTMQQMRPE